MGRFVKIPLWVALVLPGCGGGSNSGDKDIVSLTEAFLIGCGPTAHAPAVLVKDGYETFGCTVFSRSERRKVESALEIFQVNVFAPDGSGFNPRPAVVERDEASPWHAYFDLPRWAFDGVTRIEAKARYGDAETALENGGIPVYDPEGLSTRDEHENTFVPRIGIDPIADFKKIDGHILFVTEVDLIPGQDFNSVAGADLRCSIEAQKLVSLAVYKFAALLSDSKTAAKDRVSLSGPIRDVDKDVILEDAALLFAPGGFDGHLKVLNGDLATNALRVWTGTPEKNCADWASKDPARMAVVGDPSTQTWQNAGESACSQGRRIYCISR